MIQPPYSQATPKIPQVFTKSFHRFRVNRPIDPAKRLSFSI